MNLSVISRSIGISLLFNAGFMFIGVIVSIIYGFDAAFSPLLLSAFITLLAGLFPLIFVRNTNNINFKEGITIVVFAWVLSCLFGMLPYVLWGGEFSLINAWFESVSGYTTTGSTILNDIEALPKSLVFWRSATHFIGGIGVVIFMLIILPSASTFRTRISKVEISALSKQNYKFKTKQTIGVIASTYVGLFLAAMFSYVLAGMDWFNAVNHAFSVAATGGFSTLNNSIMGFDSTAIELVSIFFMFLCGLHFGLIYSFFVQRSAKIISSPIIKFYTLSLLIATLLITIDNLAHGTYTNWLVALKQSAFHVVSYASTTGFAAHDTAIWPNLSIIMLIYLSIQCACSGSTTGGIKADRVLIFVKSFINRIKTELHPKAVLPLRIGQNVIGDEMVSAVNLYIVLYLAFMLVGAAILSVMGLDFMDSFSASIASLGNVGPGFGSVGSLGNFSEFPIFGKFILTLEMLLGRLEIYTLVLVFIIWKKQ
ncbi:MAG: TrkH family potassium uptake protein [Bacteroidales bacterium]|nr:TrkH family potassium uptake protein [Bacteroidales bacterium]